MHDQRNTRFPVHMVPLAAMLACLLAPGIAIAATAAHGATPATLERASDTTVGRKPALPRAEASSDTDTTPQTPKTLQSIVVTASPIAIKQLDASYSITSVGRAQIQDTSPFSVADLLNLSPGIWAESSTGGGNAGKVFVPGYVMSMGAPFLTTMVNGTPLFGMPHVSFFTNLQLMRLDDTGDGNQAAQGDQDGDDPGKLGPVNEEIGHAGRVATSAPSAE